MKSLFIEILDKYMSRVLGRITDKYNGKNAPQELLHRRYLKEEYSADLTWASTEFANNIVAADVVAMDSSIPLKKRDSLSTAMGQLPKIAVGYKRGEKFISDVRVMAARGANEQQIAARVLADANRCVNAIESKKEALFLEGLSTGVTLIEDETNPEVGIRVDLGYKEENIFKATSGVWGTSTAKPIDDIEQLVDKASADGSSIALFFISKKYLNHLRNSDQGKQLAATYAGQVIVSTDSLRTPSRETMLQALEDEFGAPFQVVNTSIVVEGKDGTPKTTKPFAEANVVGVPSEDVGRLVYGTLAEEASPVPQVNYYKVGTHILVAEFAETNPLRECTTGQAICFPVIDNAGNVYLLQADKSGDTLELGE